MKEERTLRQANVFIENLKREVLDLGGEIVRLQKQNAALLVVAKHVAKPGNHIESLKCFHCQAAKAISQPEGKP